MSPDSLAYGRELVRCPVTKVSPHTFIAQLHGNRKQIMKRIAIACTMFTFAATSAVAQARPAASQATTTDSARVGNYDLELRTEQGTIVGALELKQVSGKLVPVITVMGHSPTVKSFTREPAHYSLNVAMGETAVSYKLRFVKDSVFGTFLMGTMDSEGSVTGARKP